MDFEKETIKNILESYADAQVNLSSEAARDRLAEEIIKTLETIWKDRIK